jgi:hypothetical protein
MMMMMMMTAINSHREETRISLLDLSHTFDFNTTLIRDITSCQTDAVIEI